MKVPCPSCGARITVREDAPGGRQTCPACMTGFEIEDENSLHPEMTIEIQGPRGEMLGNMDRYAVRQKIYSGEFQGGDKVRVGGGDWEPMIDRPEFSEIFELVGVDLDTLRLASQNIKGWKRDVSVRKTLSVSSRPSDLPEPEQVMSAKEAIWEELPLPVALGGLAAAAVVVVGVLYLFLA